MSLQSTLEAFLDPLWTAAVDLGLDPIPVEFEIVPSHAIYEVAAYGMPGHFSHWTYGRDYWRMKQRMDSGYGRLYELVIDTDPAIAFLLESNTVAAQKLVMAHVLGHADIFKNHLLVRGGPKQFHHTLAAARERFAEYAQAYGTDTVEKVLDHALSLEDQVASETSRSETGSATSRRPPYEDLFDSFTPLPGPRRAPRYQLPTADLLGFVANHSPVLEEWERDICQVVRLEGLYQEPKRQIKILHEGWATYCHQILLPNLPLSAGEQIEAARIHSAVAQPDPLRLNPYWFGWQLARIMVEDFGFVRARQIWCEETDASLVRNYLDSERIRRLELYRYEWAPGEVRTTSGNLATWDAIRRETEMEDLRTALANALAARPPVIEVVAVHNDGRLELQHVPDGMELDPQWARLTLQAVADLWGTSVTLHDGKSTFSSDES